MNTFADYGFNNDQSFNFTSDFIPPSSTPLLNVNETDFLNQLFDNPPNAFDNSTLLDAELSKSLGLDYDWLLNEAPPQLQEVSSSAAHHPQTYHPNHALPAQSAYTTAASNSIPASAPQDVLGAASALVHSPITPHHSQRPSLSISQPPPPQIPTGVSSAYLPTTPIQPTASNTSIRARRSPTAPSPQLIFNLKPYDETTDTILTPGLGATFDGSAHAGIPSKIRTEPRQSFPSPVHNRTYSESHISSHYPTTTSDEASRRLYRFGSDSHFAVNGYVRSPEEATEEQLTQRMLDENFGAIAGGFISTASSRAQSPSGYRRIKRDIEEDESDDESLRKRHRSGYDDVVSARRQSAAQTWRRRSASGASLASPSMRRRKSSPPTSGAATPGGPKKGPRENLSEEQKRSNHIVSEQKRRNLIKQGFEELNILVPGLREGGFSKSNVLLETAQYLENIIAGNEQLKAAMGQVDLG